LIVVLTAFSAAALIVVIFGGFIDISPARDESVVAFRRLQCSDATIKWLVRYVTDLHTKRTVRVGH